MMARYNLKILLLQVGLLGCIPSAFTRSISSVYTGDCDSIFLSNGTAILALPAILLLGLGFILAVVVLVKANRPRKAVIGHPNEHRLLRKIKRSKLIAMAMLFSWALLGLIQFVYLIYLFSLLGKAQ
jgi:hypothetical protein